MNSDYEKQLETGIQRELVGLGDLQAPPAMTARILRAVERHSVRPWYRRAWQTWPPALQVASLAGLTAVFGLLCFGSWELVQSPGFTSTTHEVGGWFNLVSVAWNVANALVRAITVAIESLGPLAIAGIILVLLTCYAACVGAGTVYMRLAFVRRSVREP